HPLGVLPLLVGLVAPLVLGNLLPLAQPVAIRRGDIPAHADDRMIGLQTKLFDVVLVESELGVLACELLILCEGDLLGGDGKASGNRLLMERLIAESLRISRR